MAASGIQPWLICLIVSPESWHFPKGKLKIQLLHVYGLHTLISAVSVPWAPCYAYCCSPLGDGFVVRGKYLSQVSFLSLCSSPMLFLTQKVVWHTAEEQGSEIVELWLECYMWPLGMKGMDVKGSQKNPKSFYYLGNLRLIIWAFKLLWRGNKRIVLKITTCTKSWTIWTQIGKHCNCELPACFLVSEQTVLQPKCKNDFNKCELLKAKKIHRFRTE